MNHFTRHCLIWDMRTLNLHGRLISIACEWRVKSKKLWCG